MAAKVFALVCFTIFNVARSQARICPFPESVLPNQILFNQPCSCQNQVLLPPNQFLLPNNQVLLPPNQVLLPQPNQVMLPQPGNQVILPQPCSNQVILPQGNQLLLNQPYSVEAVVPATPTTTIIQDSTVANNLANALQLLVVSNLLSNTLPQPVEYAPVLTPYAAPSCGCGLPSFNYIY